MRCMKDHNKKMKTFMVKHITHDKLSESMRWKLNKVVFIAYLLTGIEKTAALHVPKSIKTIVMDNRFVISATPYH